MATPCWAGAARTWQSLHVHSTAWTAPRLPFMRLAAHTTGREESGSQSAAIKEIPNSVYMCICFSANNMFPFKCHMQFSRIKVESSVVMVY